MSERKPELERLRAVIDAADADLVRRVDAATGVITIMADLLGYDAAGIELDAGLVAIARGLARKYDSKARFAAGSFLPTGYRWVSSDGDMRLGTIGDGPSGYLELGQPLLRYPA